MPPLTDRFPLPVLHEGSAGTPTPWRSLEERSGELAPETAEFAPGAALPPEGLARRSLLQLAGASLAVAGLSGCFRPPAEKVLPYSKAPEGLTPGVPLHYATGLVEEGYTTGLVVACREGRPIKVEGNPAHPMSLGASGPHHQATLLGLYDSDRARVVRSRGTPTSRDALRAFLTERAGAAGQGERLRFLVEPTASPLLGALYARVQERFPRARLVPFSAAASTGPSEGTRLAYGRPLTALPDFTRARVVVSLDEDFLRRSPGWLRASRDFVRARLPPRMNRLYVAEGSLSLTGAFADHRLRARPGRLEGLARALAAEVGRGLGHPLLSGLDTPSAPTEGPARAWVHAAAADLLGARGSSLVVAGARQEPLLHALALALNEALGNRGQTLRFTEPLTVPAPDPGALPALVAEMRAGDVDTLVITAWNPAYVAPVDLGLADALARVPHSIYRALQEDETSTRCAWFVPATHPFESWGDGRALDGTATILQPLIAPLLDGAVDEVDVLSPFSGTQDQSPYTQLQALWRERAGGPADFQARWDAWLAAGVIPGTAAQVVEPALQEAALAAALRQRPPGETQPEGLTLELVLDPRVQDGRWAHNAWLQELPDPITQLMWGNAALLSPATAARLGVESGQWARLELAGQRLEAPVLVAPGQADDTVTLPLGYGREAGGTVGRGVGVNAYRLRRAQDPWFSAGLALTPLPRRTSLALAQTHGRMDGRAVALQTSVQELEAHPAAYAHLRGEEPHLFPSLVPDTGYQWGMAIDLHRCTGCSACVVACQAENNIPSVGREQVLRGRRMHWLRIDRYFLGDEHDPGAITQPVACVHCEYAPCEYVCPVNATVHSDEGLNEMVYNRCIGTRYCSNNCPYKVRRFNFLDYHPRPAPIERLIFNPEVTVRSRGVIEKCTYCVQRIEGARITSRREGRTIRDGEVRTACQQACPTDAIVFGNLNDPRAAVRALHADPRHYELLHELGTHPRTVHLVRLKNPSEVLG